MRNAHALTLLVLLLVTGCEQWSMMSFRSSTDPQERMHELMNRNDSSGEEPMTPGSRIWYTDEPSHLHPEKISGGIQ